MKSKEQIKDAGAICGWCDGTGKDKGAECPLCLGKGFRFASDKSDKKRWSKLYEPKGKASKKK